MVRELRRCLSKPPRPILVRGSIHQMTKGSPPHQVRQWRPRTASASVSARASYLPRTAAYVSQAADLNYPPEVSGSLSEQSMLSKREVSCHFCNWCSWYSNKEQPSQRMVSAR